MTTDDNHREASSLLDVLRHVVETLQDAERGSKDGKTGHGTVSGKHTRTDYGFSVGTGPDPDSLWERLGVDEPSEAGDAGSSGSTTPAPADDDHLVDVREEEDAVVVLADLPRATAEDVTAGIDRERDDLVIGLGSEVIERISLGDAGIAVADSTFRNGVLEVRLRTEPEGADS